MTYICRIINFNTTVLSCNYAIISENGPHKIVLIFFVWRTKKKYLVKVYTRIFLIKTKFLIIKNDIRISKIYNDPVRHLCARHVHSREQKIFIACQLSHAITHLWTNYFQLVNTTSRTCLSNLRSSTWFDFVLLNVKCLPTT